MHRVQISHENNFIFFRVPVKLNAIKELYYYNAAGKEKLRANTKIIE